MSTATADAAAPKKGNKKVVVMAAAAVLLLAIAGGGGFMLMKKMAPADGEAEAAEGHQAAPAAATKRDPKHPPVFVLSTASR